VEDGTLVLVGATTENPSFAVVSALLSRCSVLKLEPLSSEDIVRILERALRDHPDGLGAKLLTFEANALRAIADSAMGDARRALSTLELVVDSLESRREKHISEQAVVAAQAHRSLLYDRQGEEHFNVISAFIKSMRGSDPDAAVYWMMRMLEAGEDPLFVSRRMLIFASEDVGNADPNGLVLAAAADATLLRVGMPEAIYALAHACTYLASAPKSNAASVAWQRAKELVARHGALAVPLKLRNAVTPLLREHGYGDGYVYPHAVPGGVALGEQYLPEELGGSILYEPTDRGYEAQIRERVAAFRKTSKNE
jgi:putative ATPase